MKRTKKNSYDSAIEKIAERIMAENKPSTVSAKDRERIKKLGRPYKGFGFV